MSPTPLLAVARAAGKSTDAAPARAALASASGIADQWEQISVPQQVTRLTPDGDDVDRLTRFVGKPFDFSYHDVDPQAHQRGPWRSLAGRARAISDEDLVAHLQLETSLATYCPIVETADGVRRAITTFIVIDLDLHHDDHADILRRYRQVCAALGHPSFVVSTPSGGAHVFYQLTAPTHLYSLHTPASGTGLVTRLLEAHGLACAPGAVEVYPCVRSREHAGNVCRLPFGVGCWLLDACDLTVLPWEGIAALRRVCEMMALG